MQEGCSDDSFLGGRLRVFQHLKGYRAGLDSVILAAAVPAKPGDSLLEVGVGTAVAILCLATRVPDTQLVGLEIHPDMLCLARENVLRNGFESRVSLFSGDVRDCQSEPPQIMDNSFDHAFANPPFYLEGKVSAPASSLKRSAYLRNSGDLELWIKFMARKIKEGGSLTLILPPDSLGETLAALDRRFGSISVFPLFPYAGKNANRIIIQAFKGAKGILHLARGLVLHKSGGVTSGEAGRILRDAVALALLPEGE